MKKKVPEEVWEFPKIGSKKQRAIYTPESMTHPAKMDTYLTRRLIKEYTKVGDVVADPMAGVGTTGVECVSLGRHAILVDIENKFTELCKKNLENVEKIFETGSFKPKLGKAIVITGDSRHLSKLLQENADVIVTSPPYSQSVGHQGGLDKSDFKHGCRYREHYPKSKENIGNLPEGKIDTVLTSPPFAESKAFHDLEFMKRTSQEQSEKVKKGEIKGHYMTEEARRKVFEKMEKGKTENPDNIGNFAYSKIDTVITSPPYSEQLQAKADYEKRKERLEKMGHTRKTHGLLRGQKSTSKVIGGDERYSENQNNIGNLKHGSVDAVLTSPPFAESLANENPNRRKGYWKTSGGYQSGHGVETYGKNKENIGNLKHDESVDAILTSPPYSESMTKKRKGYTIFPQLAKTREMPQDTKDENIANLSHGEIDAVITSPPYAIDPKNVCHTKEGKTLEDYDKKRGFKTTSHPRTGYSPNEKNIGNLPHESNVDAILTSPPYADIHQCPTNTGLTEFFRKQLEEKGFIEWNGKRYTEAEWRAMNHGRLDGRSTPGVKKDAKYSENPQNIGNLPHTENIDVILTSPPYVNALHDTLEKRKKWKEKGMHEAKKGLPVGYSENPENIGNIKEHGKVVDTIITSPPYSIGHDSGDKASEEFKERLEMQRRYTRQMISEGNIAKLTHGKLDAIMQKEAMLRGQLIYGPHNKITIPKNLLVYLYLDLKLSTRQIARLLHVSCTQVKDWLRENGIKPLERWQRYRLHLTRRQWEILVGTILGDSTICKKETERNYHITISHSIKYKEYLLWKINELNNILISPIQSYDNKWGVQLSVSSFRHPFFTALHKIFYPNGKKIIPRHIINNIVPLSIAVWFMDDGSLHFDQRDNTYSFRIATYCFTRKDLNHVIKILKEKFGILSSIGKDNVLYISRHSTTAFADMVKELIIPSMAYKLPPTFRVDTIITSPPYEATFNVKQHTLSGIAKRDPNYRREVGGYGQNEANIGNLRRGKDGVDAILTSPPYAESLQERGGTQHKFEKQKQIGVHYSHNKKNVGNLAYVDENLDETVKRLREHGRTDAKAGGPYGRSLAHPYSPDPANIGNLPKGTVDTILTSPPYGHEATASKPTKLEMEGLFKMGHSKETPLTDEDYRAWEMRNKGNIAKRKLFVRVPCKPEEAQFHDTREGRKGTMWEWTKEVKADLNNMEIQQQKSQKKGKTETYLEAMKKCYEEMYKVLKPNGLCIVVLKNFVRQWKIVDLVGDTERICEFVGFKLVKRIKFRLPTLSFWRVNQIKQYEKRTGKPFPMEKFESAFLYETVLVFRK